MTFNKDFVLSVLVEEYTSQLGISEQRNRDANVTLAYEAWQKANLVSNLASKLGFTDVEFLNATMDYYIEDIKPVEELQTIMLDLKDGTSVEFQIAGLSILDKTLIHRDGTREQLKFNNRGLPRKTYRDQDGTYIRLSHNNKIQRHYVV